MKRARSPDPDSDPDSAASNPGTVRMTEYLVPSESDDFYSDPEEDEPSPGSAEYDLSLPGTCRYSWKEFPDGELIIPEARNQGETGSCVEHSFIAALESRLKLAALKKGKRFNIKLSVAHLIERKETKALEILFWCARGKQNYVYILEYLTVHGVLSEEDYNDPQKRQDGHRFKISNHRIYGHKFYKDAIKLLSRRGPMLLDFALGENWLKFDGKGEYSNLDEPPIIDIFQNENGEEVQIPAGHMVLASEIIT